MNQRTEATTHPAKFRGQAIDNQACLYPAGSAGERFDLERVGIICG
ncbi:hypothetical protein [Lujinxingia sediminis]|nr:hypothetical protein [Lujinxingia sediminis]